VGKYDTHDTPVKRNKQKIMLNFFIFIMPPGNASFYEIISTTNYFSNVFLKNNEI
jgi:hypothetical protein